MQAALLAAQEWVGATAPNPPVGCALLDQEGHIITVAAHHGAGQLHAEALAIKQARDEGRLSEIAAVVVTLEPCNHHGRTPPCTEAILATPAQMVVFAQPDPNPKVAGQGAERLRSAGLIVKEFRANAETARLIAPFKKQVTQGLPWVTVKQAINLSGNMLPPPSRKTFTSPQSLLLAHQLRKRADAILTGSGTILADAPLFTIRHVPDFVGKRRRLIVLDRRERLPDVYVNEAKSRGFDVVRETTLEQALRHAAAAGCLEVLVEAGPEVTAHVLASPFWDEHVRIMQTTQGDKVEVIYNRSENVFGNH